MTDRYASRTHFGVVMATLGLHPDDAARKAGVSPETWHAWSMGLAPIPWTALRMFELMVEALQRPAIKVAWHAPGLYGMHAWHSGDDAGDDHGAAK